MADEADVLELADDMRAGDEPEQDSEPEAFHIALEGEEPEGETTPLVRQLREQIRERDRRLAARTAEPEKVEVGPRPKIDDEGIDYDPERFDSALDAWIQRSQQAKASEAAEQRRKDDEAKNGQRYATAYMKARAELPVSDFDRAEANVQSVLSASQAALLLRYAGNAAKVVYALDKYPAKLDALAATEDAGDFIIAVRDMEGKLTVGTHKPKPPAPEMDTVQSGSAPLSSGNYEKKLAKLEEEAARTGKRDPVIAFKRANREKAK